MQTHNFHIPVMGLAFTVDTPVKVARYGITSVVSIIQDSMIEKMREHYCKVYDLPYQPILTTEPDYRARRITSYLNLLHYIVNKQFDELKNSTFTPGSEITKYFELLPDSSPLKERYNTMKNLHASEIKAGLEKRLKESITPGAIDVNIMTKLDRTNYTAKGEPLGEEFTDALSALRGYALSELSSSIIFSAGLNPRLYSYTENFEDFYPDENGSIKKKIIIKVSDYRSALIQGKFLAKKGLWVSEFRVESGLNCGGHAFATDGYLLGPILEEFKVNKWKLTEELHSIFNKALIAKNKSPFADPLEMKLSVQGGVGTSREHNFLRNHYQFDSIGWGTPFLLVPEATQVDEPTLKKLAEAGKGDLYLSHSSPLGVPFNALRNSSGQEEKRQRISAGKPGSPCIRKHLTFNTEFTQKPICTASRKYQKLKLDELKTLSLPQADYQKKFDEIVEKECLCEGLANSSLINTGSAEKSSAVSICPGPNLAYFSKVATLKEMVQHIYGKISLLNTSERPNMFVNELILYVDYLQNEVKSISENLTEKQLKMLNTFKTNLLAGITYYQDLTDYLKEEGKEYKARMKEQLYELERKIICITIPDATTVCLNN
jgi:hypothetical protein